MQSTANLPVIGLDLAKTVFQLHIVDTESGEIQRRQIKRAKLADFFTKCQRSLVAMEACGTSHHWARVIRSLGHEVKMLPAQHVKAFLLRDKTDAMDAQAIWVAAQQPHIKSVPVKTERQQTCMALHGMRRQLMKMRIMQTNALRGILASGATGHKVPAIMTVFSFAVRILCMGFGAGLDTKWKASQSGNQDTAINRKAIHGGVDSFDFGGKALAANKTTPQLNTHLSEPPLVRDVFEITW